MARTPQRSGRWSLRQVSLEAGVSLATARAVVRNGHLDPARLTARDVLVLRVAAMLPSLQPIGELRPANATRQVPARDREAVRLIQHATELPETATLVVTPDGATLANTLGEVVDAIFATGRRPHLSLPVGQWAAELATSARGEVAA